MSINHPFAPFVRILGRGKKASRALTEAEAHQAMTMILNDDVEPLQLGAFLMLIRVREETPEEVAGFARACREHIALPQDSVTVDLDWSSYAGKRRHLPWFILSVLCLANHGIRTFMHGARGHTEGRIYTYETLQALGIPPADSTETAIQQLKENNFAYLDLEQLCPKLQHIMSLRSLLGLRSPVHTVARMLNPFSANHVMQGIFHPGYLNIHQQAGVLLDQTHFAAIKGDGGEIEINPDAPCPIHLIKNGHCSEEEWPAAFSRRHKKPDNLDIDLLQQVWHKERQDEYGEAAVVNTLAVTLYMMNKATNRQEALALAQTLWDERPRDFLK